MRGAGSAPATAAPAGNGVRAYARGVLAIVPVKGRDGKSRLDRFLSPNERARLVAAMLADVLAACDGARAVDDVLVVTPDPETAPPAVQSLVDRGAGHAEAIESALADPRAADGALVVMADCPLVRPVSLDRLVAAARPIALVPAVDGGLNALALRATTGFEPAFGVAGAARVTAERARTAGLHATILEDRALAFDVDVPADVQTLARLGDGSRASRVLATFTRASAAVR